MHNFEIGHLYNRLSDIHLKYGGSRRSGISPSAKFPYIFLFTGEVGNQYGYSDGWDENGIFRYTGEGQIGDMQFKSGNKAIRDHIDNGKDLLLFESRGKGKTYRFLGEFICSSYEFNTIPDREGKIRQGIVFHLANVNEELDEVEKTEFKNISLEELKKKAYEVSESITQTEPKTGLRKFYKRSQSVKDYVLRRANGFCECCGQPAPFSKSDGTPYLEPHHIRKLSDNGLDHPQWVAALTPNCHREIHHGKDGRMKNEKLIEAIRAKEIAF